jgi:zinc transport system ATP-binding protein
VPKEIISLKNISLLIDNEYVLENINFNIYQGETLTIIGQNGGGKTVLLEIILGLIKPTIGTLQIQKGLTFAYMPNTNFSSCKNLPLTVKDFILLFVKAISAKTEQYIEDLKLTKTLNQHISRLSSGQSKALFFLVTIIQNCDIMLLDEPEQNLDKELKKTILQIMSKDFADKTKIIVSHNIGIVPHDTNRVICLNKTIHCQGKPEEITKDALMQIFPDISHMWSIYKENQK